MNGFEKRIEALAMLLKQANSGDISAYRLFLEHLAPVVRGMAKRMIFRIGAPISDLEDAVQETLLAIHLKRHTWLEDQPIKPWIGAITRYKLIDIARKYGRRQEIQIDDTFDYAAPEPENFMLEGQEMDRLFGCISEKQRMIVKSISLKGMPISEVAATMNMSEGAVRVALHRALKALALAYRRHEL